MSSTETTYRQDLSDALVVLGGAAEIPHWAFAGLAAGLEARGTPVADLTVGELLDAITATAEHVRSLT